MSRLDTFKNALEDKSTVHPTSCPLVSDETLAELKMNYLVRVVDAYCGIASCQKCPIWFLQRNTSCLD